MIIPFLITTVNSEKKKVLIIEDNVETQLIYKVYLRSFYDVEIADTGESGLELLKQKKFDILLLDINLPGKLNGEDVLKIIRKELKLSNFPIIVLTAYALRGDREKFINMGANNYISKPVDKSVLLEEVKKLLA
jgi:CheY-like chemotaxis protein